MMQIAYFEQGRKGFVAHKYRIDGVKSKFSLWFNRDGFPIDAERIDSRGRSYAVNRNSDMWRHIEKYKIAGLSNASEIEKSYKESK